MHSIQGKWCDCYLNQPGSFFFQKSELYILDLLWLSVGAEVGGMAMIISFTNTCCLCYVLKFSEQDSLLGQFSCLNLSKLCYTSSAYGDNLLKNTMQRLTVYASFTYSQLWSEALGDGSLRLGSRLSSATKEVQAKPGLYKTVSKSKQGGRGKEPKREGNNS